MWKEWQRRASAVSIVRYVSFDDRERERGKEGGGKRTYIARWPNSLTRHAKNRRAARNADGYWACLDPLWAIFRYSRAFGVMY